MAAGSLPGNLPEPGEGLRSLRKPYRRHKKGSYVCRLIWAAHLDDYPTADPISGEKRIAGLSPALTPGRALGARGFMGGMGWSFVLSVSQSHRGWWFPEKQPGRGPRQLAGVRSSCGRWCWPSTRHPRVAFSDMLLQKKRHESSPWAVLVSMQLLNPVSGNPGLKQQHASGARGGGGETERSPSSRNTHDRVSLVTQESLWGP